MFAYSFVPKKMVGMIVLPDSFLFCFSQVSRRLKKLRIQQYAHVVKETPDGERRHYYATEKYKYQKKGLIGDEMDGGRFDSVRIACDDGVLGAGKVMAFLEVYDFAKAGIDPPDNDDFMLYGLVRWYRGLCRIK